MRRRPPRSTRHVTLLPDTTLFRSHRLAARTSRQFFGRQNLDTLRQQSRSWRSALVIVTGGARQRHRHDASSVQRRASTSHWQGVRYTGRSEEHTSELQSLMRISYSVFCLQKIITITKHWTLI